MCPTWLQRRAPHPTPPPALSAHTTEPWHTGSPVAPKPSRKSLHSATGSKPKAIAGDGEGGQRRRSSVRTIEQLVGDGSEGERGEEGPEHSSTGQQAAQRGNKAARGALGARRGSKDKGACPRDLSCSVS